MDTNVQYLLEALNNKDLKHAVTILENMERGERLFLARKLSILTKFMREYEEARDTAFQFPAKNEE